jgi:peroxiredoxin
MSIPNTTTAHIDFNDWLNQCPVKWSQVFSEKITEEIAVYVFTLPDTITPD